MEVEVRMMFREALGVGKRLQVEVDVEEIRGGMWDLYRRRRRAARTWGKSSWICCSFSTPISLRSPRHSFHLPTAKKAKVDLGRTAHG
jgi:hypothetical protein